MFRTEISTPLYCFSFKHGGRVVLFLFLPYNITNRVLYPLYLSSELHPLASGILHSGVELTTCLLAKSKRVSLTTATKNVTVPSKQTKGISLHT